MVQCNSQTCQKLYFLVLFLIHCCNLIFNVLYGGVRLRKELDKLNFAKIFDKLCRDSQKSNITLSSEDNLGIRADKLSKLRSENDAVKPSVDDLLSISQYFHISLDELTGNKVEISNNEVSLLDIVEPLFTLSQLTDIKIEHTFVPAHTEAIGFPPNETEFIEVEAKEGDICISFEHEQIKRILGEWSEALKIKENFETGESLYTNWKNGIMEASSNRLEKWDFRNKEEEGDRLYKRLMKAHYDYCITQGGAYALVNLPGNWSEVEIEFIDNYVRCNPHLNTGEYINALSLARAKRAENDGFMNIPDGNDEELPF